MFFPAASWFSSHVLNYFDSFGNIKLGCIEVTATGFDLCEESTAALRNSQAVFISKLTADHMMELDNTTLYDVLEIPMNTRRSDVVISMKAIQGRLYILGHSIAGSKSGHI
ncbi:hypothetical protein VPH35_110088 [Triticum aestivum]